jgi:8-oxo-dGTP pyrophosphatase MutT (NUDIX family)
VSDDRIRDRRAGRVLVINDDGRVLLLHGVDPADPDHPFWFTVGGGIEPGESAAEAASRELREEAGLTATPDALGDPVWHRETEFSFDTTSYQQTEVYFLLRAGSGQVSLDGMDDIEKETVDGYGWWNAEELEAASEPFFPRELPGLLRELGYGEDREPGPGRG